MSSKNINLILNHFRKDNIIFTICISITLIGSLLIIIKKLISRQIIQRIPKSNILTKPKNNHEQTFQMATFHNTPRLIQINTNATSDLFLLCQKHGLPLCPGKHGNISILEKNETLGPSVLLNHSKYNKNIINLSGLFIIGMIYCIGLAFGFSSRFDFIVFPQGILYVFVHCCCVPVLLPTIYFMRNQEHLISVLRDHNLFSFCFRT